MTPDVAVPPRAALAAAHAHALQQLLAGASNPGLRREWERTITVGNGRLIHRRRPNMLGEELVPLSETHFATGPQRFAFERGAGNEMRLRAVAPNGLAVVFDRSGPPPAIPSEYR